jgi:hypothetical protein
MHREMALTRNQAAKRFADRVADRFGGHPTHDEETGGIGVARQRCARITRGQDVNGRMFKAVVAACFQYQGIFEDGHGVSFKKDYTFENKPGMNRD